MALKMLFNCYLLVLKSSMLLFAVWALKVKVIQSIDSLKKESTEIGVNRRWVYCPERLEYFSLLLLLHSLTTALYSILYISARGIVFMSAASSSSSAPLMVPEKNQGKGGNDHENSSGYASPGDISWREELTTPSSSQSTTRRRAAISERSVGGSSPSASLREAVERILHKAENEWLSIKLDFKEVIHRAAESFLSLLKRNKCSSSPSFSAALIDALEDIVPSLRQKEMIQLVALFLSLSTCCYRESLRIEDMIPLFRAMLDTIDSLSTSSSSSTLHIFTLRFKKSMLHVLRTACFEFSDKFMP